MCIHSAFRLSFRECRSIDYKKIRKQDVVNVSAGCGQNRMLFTATFEGGLGVSVTHNKASLIAKVKFL